MTHLQKMAATMATECVTHRARQVARLLTRKYDEAIRPLGVQSSQLLVLVAIASAGEQGAPLGRVADALLVDQTTMSRNVVPLKKAGLLRQETDPHDARARLVVLTPKGRRLVEAAYPRWKAAQRSIERALGSRRLAAIRDDLGAIVSAADAIVLGSPFSGRGER